MGPLLLYLLSLLVGAYVVWGLTLLVMQPRLLYRPLRDVAFTPADQNVDYEDVTFGSSGGVTLTGWYVPAPGAHLTVLFCHGNGGNIMHRLDTVVLFRSLGLNCFVFDYRGYGASSGRPTEKGTYLDARAAYDWLIAHKGVPPERIILLGRSLGGSVAAHLAGRVPVRGLVVESAFTSFPDIGARFYPYMPVRFFALFRYNTRAYLKQVTCPVLIMHSRDDALVPYQFGVQLFKAANEPKRFVELAGGHNDAFLVSGDVYRNAWTQWLDAIARDERADVLHKVS
jgi:hypothetical protein